jgi:tRNA dimethylallyltransferase
MSIKPKVLIIIGPTGVGKSELAYTTIPGLCPHAHIINADSQQVYQGLDIGTAKPTKTEQGLLPHHLFDICTPNQQFSAGDFKQSAQDLVASISESGGLPVFLGGTGFYLRHLLYDYSNPPPSDSHIRAQLEMDCNTYGLSVMRERLFDCDPDSYQEISANDKYRVLRALEIYLVSGKPRKYFIHSLKPRSDWDWKLLCLNRPRQQLYDRINLRADTMIHLGLITEIQGLLSAGWTFQDPGLQAIGYKEFESYFSNNDTSESIEAQDITRDQLLDKVIEQIKQHTRNYAKRQLTFFRGFKEALWLDNPDQESFAQIINQYGHL